MIYTYFKCPRCDHVVLFTCKCWGNGEYYSCCVCKNATTTLLIWSKTYDNIIQLTEGLPQNIYLEEFESK